MFDGAILTLRSDEVPELERALEWKVQFKVEKFDC